MRKYLFVLSPPFSGSTVLWRLLATSPNVSTFSVEGQYLESVEHIFRQSPWDTQHEIPWIFVKKKWEEAWNLDKLILLEKSPPHLIRAFEIEKVFLPAHFVLLIRNPYAFCEGYSRRTHKSMEEAAEFWIRCAKTQKRNLDELENSILFTYEAFTENSHDICKKLLLFLPELGYLDPQQSFTARSIVSYESRKIYNFNQIKINQLSTEEILGINSILDSNLDLMRFFGYEIIKPATSHKFVRYKSIILLRLIRVFARIKRVSHRILQGM